MTLNNKIVDFLTSLPNIHDTESQRAFIYRTGLDPQLQDQIPFGKPPVQFVPLLVSILLDYGKLSDGRYALEAVLEVAKQYVGQDRRAYCDALLQEFHLNESAQNEKDRAYILQWEKFASKDLNNILRSREGPIRRVKYDTLIRRLGRSGKIPWIDRGVTSPGLLRQYGQIAIVGWMKSGKTREAAELIRMTVEDGWISEVYEPTSTLDLIEQNSLAEAIAAEVDERQRLLFLVDELGLRPERERLENLSICVQTIKETRPDAYFLITIQRERLSKEVQEWLQKHQFHHITMPKLNLNQREELVNNAIDVLGIKKITSEERNILATQTDGRPYTIVFTLQQASNSDILNKKGLKALLERSDEEGWAEQRRQVENTEPLAAFLLDSIATYVSAGVTTRETSIRCYAEYSYSDSKLKRKEFNKQLDKAAERWARFDIVATDELYNIPEPLVLPLLIPVDEARDSLKQFVENYNPGFWLSLMLNIMRPLDVLLQLHFRKYWRVRWTFKLKSKFRLIRKFWNHAKVKKIRDKYIRDNWRRMIKWISETLLAWKADRALLIMELGSELKKVEYFSSAALVVRAKKFYGEQKPETALRYLDKALALNPNNAYGFLWRGWVYIKIKRFEEAITNFNRAIDIDPEYTPAYNLLGLTYLEMDDHEKAIEAFTKAVEIDPDYKWAWGNRGISYRTLKEYDKSLADLNRAIDIDPEDDWATAQRGITYRQMKRYDEALADFNQAIDIDPEYTRAHNLLGLTYQEMDDYEKAIEAFTKAVEIDPDYKWAWANRGISYRKLKEYDKSLADFNRAIDIDPEYDWAIQERGEIYCLKGLYQKAIKEFDSAIKIKSNDWRLYFRGLAYLTLKEFRKAQSDFDSAILQAEENYKKNPREWGNVFNLALYRLAANELEKAERLYKKALKDDVLKHIITEARDDLNDFLNVFPENSTAKTMLDLLNKHLKAT